jgi:hypothetical protein
MGKVIYTEDESRKVLCFNCAVKSKEGINADALDDNDTYDCYTCKECGRYIY